MSKRDPLLNESRLTRSLVAVALLLVLLGSGNIIFAQYKYQQYLVLLSTSAIQQTSTPLIEDFPLKNLRELSGRAEQQFRRIKVRLDFYTFVVSGGKVLVATGLALALVAILVRMGLFGEAGRWAPQADNSTKARTL